MSKFIRKNLEGIKYVHVTMHGIAEEYIFSELREKREIRKLLLQNQEQFNILVIAYCIMNNHLHLLLKFENPEKLSRYMHKVNASYAIYYNKQHKRSGYVYKGRFYSQIIANRTHFINTIIYIHNNPVKAKICKDASQYEFSSYKELFNKARVSSTLQLFGTKENYISVHRNIKRNQEYKDKFEKITEIEINEIVNDYLIKNSINIEDLKRRKEKLQEISRILKDDYNVTYRQLEKTLQVGRETIRRLLIK